MDNQMAEVGVFPELLDLAVQTAKSLSDGEVGYLEKYPSFGVCPVGAFNGQGVKVVDFADDGKDFVLFEVVW